jgi:hypothetical protein
MDMPKILDRPVDPVSIHASEKIIVLRIKDADYGNRLLRLSPSEARLVAHALLAEAEKLAEKSN